jgi:hypothetical protein
MTYSSQLTSSLHELLDSVAASAKYVEAIEALRQIKGSSSPPAAREADVTDLLEGTAKQLARATTCLGRIYKVYTATIVDDISQGRSRILQSRDGL